MKLFLDHLRYQLNHLLFDVGIGRSRTEGEQLILFLFCPEDWWEDLRTFIKEELKISEDLFIFNEGTAVPTLHFCLKTIS